MDAIIYESGTGFTKRYALMLAEKLGIKAYSLKEAAGDVEKGAQVLFLGWVRANEVQGLKKSQKSWEVKAVCAVGMFPKSAALAELIASENGLSCPLFLLRGGLCRSRLKGFNRLLIGMLTKDMEREAKPENAELLEVLKNGGDFVSEDNLSEVVAFMLMQK